MSDPRDHPTAAARERASARSAHLREPLEQRVDLDALRGWRERRAPALRSAHLLPGLARLVRLTPGPGSGPEGPRQAWAIHGPEVLLGRYHTTHGPVDLGLEGLLDHELYRLGAPHLRLKLHERGHWRVMTLSPSARTELNGAALAQTQREHDLVDGDVLTVGVVALRFEVQPEADRARWMRLREDVLRTEERPALFLKRAGGICGPRHALDGPEGAVIGRAFPEAASLARPRHWAAHREPDWDLSGSREHERRYIAPRHVALRPIHDHDWEIHPLSERQRTFVNRVEITEPRALVPGDEIGLGTVLFHFHHPQAAEPSRRHTIRLPHIVDWHHERAAPESSDE